MPITLRLPADLLADVDGLASSSRRSRNGEIVWALEEHLRRQRPDAAPDTAPDGGDGGE